MKWICEKAAECPLGATHCHALVPHDKKPWCEYGCMEREDKSQVAGPCVPCEEVEVGE